MAKWCQIVSNAAKSGHGCCVRQRRGVVLKSKVFGMNKVFIDSKRKLVIVNGRKIPRLLLMLIRGAIGKKFVVKHYKGRKIVITKYPDMSGIVPSAKQKACRALFREAVVYAKWIVEDAERKEAFRNDLPRRKRKRVFQAAVQMYMRMEGDQQWLRKQLAVKEVVRNVKRETSNVNGFVEQRERWRVMWQKTKRRCGEVVGGVVEEQGLVSLRI